MDIFLVEDQPTLSLTYSAMFTKLGYSVETFSCPDDFLTHMRCDQYQPPRLAIFSDILMPGGTGYHLMHEVRKRYPQQKFIMLSSTPLEEHGEDFACMYFCKPLGIDRLKAALDLLERCYQCGKDCMPDQCEKADDREQFPLQDWQCPKQSPGREGDSESSGFH